SHQMAVLNESQEGLISEIGMGSDVTPPL
ncbi:MAG: hypothetical protein PWP73_894, partial [Methanococcus sp.]|nr:hypothetical protein [Methanococcus sp.]